MDTTRQSGPATPEADAARPAGSRPAVGVVIPAKDEAPRVGSVVKLALASGLFTRVVVVDDGSRDSTAEAARDAGAEVVVHARNLGKPAAMRTGLRELATPVVCFLDADLTDVTPEHLAALVGPVRDGECLATLGVFRGGRAATSLAQAIAPMISGQRCLRVELLADFADWDSGYGIETAINAHLLAHGIRQRVVYWTGAGQVMKEEKWGFWRGLAARIRMYWQILRVWLRTKLPPRRRG